MTRTAVARRPPPGTPLKAVLEQATKDGDLTRAGVRETVAKTTVNYEGALPDRKYGDPAANVVKEGLISKPDEKAPLGASVEKDFFTGPTAEKFEVSGPCSAAG